LFYPDKWLPLHHQTKTNIMKNLQIHKNINSKQAMVKLIGKVTPESIKFNAMVLRSSKNK